MKTIEQQAIALVEALPDPEKPGRIADPPRNDLYDERRMVRFQIAGRECCIMGYAAYLRERYPDHYWQDGRTRFPSGKNAERQVGISEEMVWALMNANDLPFTKHPDLRAAILRKAGLL